MSGLETIDAGNHQNVFEVAKKNVLFLYYDDPNVKKVFIHSDKQFFNVTLPKNYYYCGTETFFCPIRKRYKSNAVSSIRLLFKIIELRESDICML